MTDTEVYWKRNNVTGMWEPSGYPSDIEEQDYSLPSAISPDFSRLNSQIEHKYTREYVKICAFYNKLFPTLKSLDWSRSSSNSLPFSAQEQERMDGSTGIAENYMKAIIDKVVARVSNIKYDVALTSDTPSLLLEIYKEPIERHLRSLIKNNHLQELVTEIFHDAAVLGYGYFFIDPWSGLIRKVADWEIGFYEAEFNFGPLRHLLVRDFSFPASEIGPYVRNMPREKLLEVLSGNRPQVDLKLYIDTLLQKAWATIDAYTLDPIPYPFDYVLLSTYAWDLGIKRTLTSNMFDLLYPIQRSIAKLNAKKTQLIEAYKGPVPVFNNDCDVIVKSMGNGAGEALFLSSGRAPAEILTVINPTPLDPEMNAEKEAEKSAMQELAGVEEISLDMENIRSAATVIALNQLHDQQFQSQLTQVGSFVGETLEMAIKFAATMEPEEQIEAVPWAELRTMVENCNITVTALHNNDPANSSLEEVPDYGLIIVDKAVIALLAGTKKWEDVTDDYTIDIPLLKSALATKLQRIIATTPTEKHSEARDNIEQALLSAFIEDVATGQFAL